MAQSRRSKRKENLAAQVFLRSVSGRSVRDIGAGPAPADLAPYRPAQADSAAVVRFLEERGFKVHRDELGLTVSIEAPPSLFKKTFGITADPAKITATETTRLRVPKEIAGFVEEIVVVPKPEYF
jgi:hypothetical protein